MSFRFRSRLRLLIIGIGIARTVISIIRFVYTLAVSIELKFNRQRAVNVQELEIGIPETSAT